MVTHDIDEAVRLGDRIAVMRTRAGTWSSTTPPPRVLGRPVNTFVADFVGSDRLIKLMAVTSVEASVLAPPAGSDDGLPVLPDRSTLQEAAIVLLGSPDGRAAVRGDDGRPLGTITLDGLRRILAADSN